MGVFGPNRLEWLERVHALVIYITILWPDSVPLCCCITVARPLNAISAIILFGNWARTYCTYSA